MKLVLAAGALCALGAPMACGGRTSGIGAGPGDAGDASVTDAAVVVSDDGGHAVADGGYDGDSDAGPVLTVIDGGWDASEDAGVVDAGMVDAATDAGPTIDTCPINDFDASDFGTVNASLNANGVQNIPSGSTPSGSSMLVLRGTAACSYGLSLVVADESPVGSGTYQTLAVPFLTGMDVSEEESVTLTADGLTLIGLNTAHQGFLTSTRSQVGKADFGAPVTGSFSAIVAPSGAELWAPVVSSDGLAFYYTVQSGSIPGLYESVRGSTTTAFPAGTLMSPDVQSFAQYVNGVSADRLTIFLAGKSVYETGVMKRMTATGAFANPSGPDAGPPTVPGLRTRPLAGCTQLLGSSAPGGCTNERVATWRAQ